MVQVHSQPLERHYHASRFSMSWIVSVVLWAAIIIAPFLLGLTSFSFYKKFGTYREQPIVEFDNKVYVVLAGQERSTGNPVTIGYSSSNEVNVMLGASNVRQPVFKVWQEDYNADSKYDSFNFSVEFPLNQGERIHSIQGFFFVKVAFNDLVVMRMQAPIVVNEQFALPVAGHTVRGRLRVAQQNPIDSGEIRKVYDVNDILDPAKVGTFQDVATSTLLQKISTRNESLVIESSNLFSSPRYATGFETSFRLEGELQIQEQYVEYIPIVSEVLKFAWIQYLAIFFIVHYCATKLMDFVYGSHIFAVSTHNDGTAPYFAKPHLN